MTGELYINSKDAYTEWGICLEDGSEDKLLMAAPMKDYISNNSRLEDGVQILSGSIKINERDVTLVFCFLNNGADFVTRYNSFISTMYDGAITLNVTRLNKTYHLYYKNCTSLSSYIYQGKLAVNFCEPNPLNNA